MSDLARLRIWDDQVIRGALWWYLDVAENRRQAKFRSAATVATQLDPGQAARTGGRRATEQRSHDDWMRRSPSARGIAAGVALERRLYAAVFTWRAASKAKGLIIEYRCA
jgi:hypothetical protein